MSCIDNQFLDDSNKDCEPEDYIAKQGIAVISEDRYKRSNTDLSIHSESSTISVSERMQQKINSKIEKNKTTYYNMNKKIPTVTQNWAEDQKLSEHPKYYESNPNQD